MAASLDYLSGGRMILGAGVGWLAEEFELLSQRFDDRYERTAECIAVLRACWGPNPVRFKGNHFDLPPFAMSPKSVKGAGMRVLVGGTGDSALRLLAEAGNGWHPLNVSPAAYESALGRLQPLMAERRRSMSDLMLTAVIDCKLVTSRRVVDDYASLGVVLIVLDIDYSSGSLAAAEAEMERLGTILDL